MQAGHVRDRLLVGGLDVLIYEMLVRQSLSLRPRWFSLTFSHKKWVLVSLITTGVAAPVDLRPCHRRGAMQTPHAHYDNDAARACLLTPAAGNDYGDHHDSGDEMTMKIAMTATVTTQRLQQRQPRNDGGDSDSDDDATTTTATANSHLRRQRRRWR